MDGVEGRGQIVIIGATNRVDAVDPALRRPGRFDREFQFQLPSKLARLAILNVHMRDWNPPVDEEFKRELAEKCVGYCGADIKALCTEAALRAIRRHFPQIYNTTNRLLLDPSQVVVTHDDFGEAMKDIVPASFRPAGVHARPLIAELEPLLNHSFIESQQKLGEIFILPPSKINAEASQDPELDLYDFDSVTPSGMVLYLHQSNCINYLWTTLK
jgi:SpoVK/Ycf46/Vps4 family AAA+-type ATPase